MMKGREEVICDDDRSDCRYVDPGAECKYGPAYVSRYPRLKLKRSMAQIMKEEGFIKNFEFIENKNRALSVFI